MTPYVPVSTHCSTLSPPRPHRTGLDFVPPVFVTPLPLVFPERRLTYRVYASLLCLYCISPATLHPSLPSSLVLLHFRDPRSWLLFFPDPPYGSSNPPGNCISLIDVNNTSSLAPPDFPLMEHGGGVSHEDEHLFSAPQPGKVTPTFAMTLSDLFAP